MEKNLPQIEGTDEQNRDYQQALSTAEKFNWFENLDQFLDEQDVALEALKKAIK